MDFSKLKHSDYLAINPMGTSPGFRDTDLDITMWESGAILDYLLERYDTDYRFHPAPCGNGSTASVEHIKMRAKYLQLKHYIIATVYPSVASLRIHSLRDPEDIDAAYTTSAKHKCKTLLNPVLTQWLGEGPYFLGDQLSALDFLVAKPLGNARSMGLLGDFPALDALLGRISSLPTHKMAYETLPSQQQAGKELTLSHPNDPSPIGLVPKREGKITATTVPLVSMQLNCLKLKSSAMELDCKYSTDSTNTSHSG
jgi:glutathione S-transferase